MTDSITNNTANQCGLLLTQDGVYLGEIFKNKLSKMPVNKVYALEPDLLIRGLEQIFYTMPNIKLINYAEFVELITKYNQTITW